jgi:hypothetical protein
MLERKADYDRDAYVGEAPMATQYDSQVLQQYADDLYRQAQSIMVWTAIKYGSLVFLLSLIALSAFNAAQRSASDVSTGLVVVAVLTAVGVVVGVGAGRLKAFNLKLEAQRLLCQLQIEQNTRTVDKAMATHS